MPPWCVFHKWLEAGKLKFSVDEQFVANSEARLVILYVPKFPKKKVWDTVEAEYIESGIEKSSINR